MGDVLSEVVVQDDEVLVRYYMKSLVTSIPVEESILICEQRLSTDNSLSDRTDLDVMTIVEFFVQNSTIILIRYDHLQEHAHNNV